MPYFRRRGFRGLGVSDTLACNWATVPECGMSDLFSVGQACQDAINACIYPSSAPGQSAGLNLTPAPSAGPISTPELIAQTQAPTGSNVAPDAAAALKAYQAAVAAANTCPAGTTPQSDGTCAAPNPFSMPWWGWAAVAGVGLLVVLK
jgi:hypothetical protein